MPDIANITYHQTEKSIRSNAMGMREMQEKAFEKRDAQHHLPIGQSA